MGTILYRSQAQPCKQHPAWSYDAVLYELNTRQFSEEGTFRAVESELPRLKRLGVDVIWMMPIFPIGEERRKGSLGSYYSIRDYTAVNPEFGTMEDFRRLVDRIHELDMKVILDWVPNHTSRDAVWTVEHPDWYCHDEATGEIATPFDWTDTAQLDYNNRDMRRGMIEAMRGWLTGSGIDGFRVDMAMLEPLEFWNDAVAELSVTSPDLFMLAEAEGVDFHNKAFDATYTWELHHLMVDVAQGRAGAQALRDRMKYESESYPLEAIRMMFTSNHDENSWNGSEFHRFGAAARMMAAMTFLLPGMPLIYNGQESGSDRSLAFFDKDCVDWNGLGGECEQLYTELTRLRHTHPALRGAGQGGDLMSVDSSLPDKVFAVKRKIGDRVVFGLFNCSGDHADLSFYDDDFGGAYHQVGSTEQALLRSGAPFYLPPWGCFVYYR